MKSRVKERVNFVVALPAEARPIIRHFHLTQTNRAPYQTYRSSTGDLWLVISGIGKIASASATTFLAAQCHDPGHAAWLNVGIAGHRDLPVGTPVLAHRITEASTGRSWFPPIIFRPPCQTASVRTVDQPVDEYPTDDVFEMEGTGFYGTASGFSGPGMVNVFKVISDNQGASTHRISGPEVLQLIGQCLGQIEQIVTSLSQMARASAQRNQARTVPFRKESEG